MIKNKTSNLYSDMKYNGGRAATNDTNNGGRMIKIKNEISPCSLLAKDRASKDTCMSRDYVEKLSQKIGSKATHADIMQKMGCEDDKCILVKAQQYLPEETIREVKTKYKVSGPTGINLLSNNEIDRTLLQWEEHFCEHAKNVADESSTGMPASCFFAYNFNMRDYEKYSWKSGRILNEPDTLATIKFEELYYPDKPVNRKGQILRGRRYNCAGCVLNTDSYHGQGEHWMAIFVDWRKNDEWSVEFFNSSGRPPKAHWVRYMERMSAEMRRVAERENITVNVDTHIVVKHQLQRSMTECGVYSLFYIWSRLTGISHEQFSRKDAVPDQEMFKFRQHLFYDRKTRIDFADGHFDWDKFEKAYHPKWEPGSRE